MVGTTLGTYKVVEHLGDGGMGSVYRATDELLERDVALKFLRPALVGHPEIAERFRIEAVALARLQHPNIATLYGFVRSDERMFMVMEFVRGETVQALLEREGKLSVERALSICEEALLALEYAHSANIVHRDIKPANLMLGADGHVKLMDFGVARVLGTERYTRTGLAVGTVTYMSPEQINGPGVDVDGRSDIYSLGIVMYQLLTGHVPFSAESEYALMHAHLTTPPPAFSLVADVPQAVEAVVLRAIEKRPDARYQTPAEFRAAIVDARAQIDGSLRRTTTRRPPRPAADAGAKRKKLTDPGAPTVGVRAIKPRPSSGRHTAKTTPAVELPKTELAVTAPAAGPASDPAPTTPAIPIPAVTQTGGPTPQKRPRWLNAAIAAAVFLMGAAGIAWILLSNAARPAPVDFAQAPAAPPGIETEVQRPRDPTAEEIARLTVVPASPPVVETPTAPAAASGAASVAVAEAPAPAPAAAAEAPVVPAAPAVPTRTFENVRLAFREGNDNRERDIRLTFGPAAVVVADRRTGASLNELEYSAISGATYVQAREPRWQEEGARVDLAPRRGSAFGFLTSSPHWLTLQTATEAVAIQVDGGIRRQVLSELAARGIKVAEPR